MADGTNQRITLELPEGGGSVFAEVNAADVRTLLDLLDGSDARTLSATVRDESDTSGHRQGGSVIDLDVEGHAIALRLPHGADAELVRRRIAQAAGITVLAGAIAIGVASTQGSLPTTVVPEAAPAPAIVTPPTRQDLILRINANDGGVVVPIRGDEQQPPAPPRPGEPAKPF